VGTALVEEVKALAKSVESDEEVLNVATIATGSPVMGENIQKAFKRVGKNGKVLVENAYATRDRVEFTEGMEMDRGYLSPYFLTDKERQVCELEAPRVLITDMTISNLRQIAEMLQPFVKSKEPLMIIAEDVTGEALSSLAVNSKKGIIKVCAIKAPSFGDSRTEFLQDLATLTGSTFVTQELAMRLENVTDDQLGVAEFITVTKDSTTVVGTGTFNETVSKRLSDLRKQYEIAESEYYKDQLQERMAKLGGAIGRIKVGASTETELQDKKLRYEDALNSAQAALKDGILPGGGSTMVYLLRTKQKVMEAMEVEDEDEKLAVDVMYNALRAPLIQIAHNAGQEGEYVVEMVQDKEFGYGWNAATNKYEDLLESGVLDPATVTEQAILNSVSIAASVITAAALVAEIPDEKDLTAMEQGDVAFGDSDYM